MTEKEVLARAAIQKTMAICAQMGDRRKADEYAACFAEDGELILDKAYKGREAIRGWMGYRPDTTASAKQATASATPSFVCHNLTTCRIDLTSETTAEVKTYFFVTTSIGPDHCGYYDDVFVKAGDEWLIASRRPKALWMSPDSVMPRTARADDKL
jgi:SnoaL-like domain